MSDKMTSQLQIRYDQLLGALATALDIVENEVVGVTTFHCRRVAMLTVTMGKFLQLDSIDLRNAWACALFHDSAITESFAGERMQTTALRDHLTIGQVNAQAILPDEKIDGWVLYHHELPAGNGVLGKHEGEYPLVAELIQIADSQDIRNDFSAFTDDQLPQIHAMIKRDSGTFFTRRAADVLLRVFDKNLLHSLRSDMIETTSIAVLPAWWKAIDAQAIFQLAAVIARIIDYKSQFTRRHSTQIANKAWLLACHYGYSTADSAALFLSAALHDIGKIVTPTAILEKPGQLTDSEFTEIKNHVKHSHQILKNISGLEKIIEWAVAHHEKLNGKGYHRGIGADGLDFNSRVLAVIDIYQAISEKRPYHEMRSHADTIKIMREMSDFIDQGIVDDVDLVFAPYSLRDVPPPGLLIKTNDE